MAAATAEECVKEQLQAEQKQRQEQQQEEEEQQQEEKKKGGGRGTGEVGAGGGAAATGGGGGYEALPRLPTLFSIHLELSVQLCVPPSVMDGCGKVHRCCWEEKGEEGGVRVRQEREGEVLGVSSPERQTKQAGEREGQRDI